VFAHQHGFESPRGQIEIAVATIWAEAMNVERVGRHDNFFDLGGHSLLLLKVHAQLQERLQLQPTIVDLFRYPTVSELAAFLESGEQQRSHQPVAERAGRQRRAFLRARSAAEGALS
jgi:acyl carrier protein